MDLDRSGLWLRRELLTEGICDDELGRARRQGQALTVRRGAYVGSADERLRDPLALHLLTVHAAVRQLPPRAVVSHVSAAVLHGLDIWAVPLTRVHVTRSRSSGGRSGRHLHLHTAPLDADEVDEVGGVQTTTVARTVVDLARSVPFEQAVVSADAALRIGLVDAAELRHAVDRAAHRPGNRRARRVVEFADGRSESVGESRSRVALQRAGVPAPALQHEVRSATGLLVARVDFWWAARATVGEFDGAVKYRRLLRPGQDAGDAVFAEKIREDAVRAEGVRVVRWTWRELDDFATVVARLRV
jgi:hypothetical protein